MNENEQSHGIKGGFFSLDLSLVDSMASKGVSVDCIYAFVVLSRGTNQKGNLRVTTWGAYGIRGHVGMTYARAEKALNELEELNYISKPITSSNNNQEKKSRPKWIMPKKGENDIYLANDLVDGIGKGSHNPPLMRMYLEAQIRTTGVVARIRLNTLMVLLHLYQRHDFAGCGGVDPRSGIYRQWILAKPEDHFGFMDDREQVTDLPGTGAALYEIQARQIVMWKGFARDALFYITNDDELKEEFWEAFHNLKYQGLIYEVIQVWSSDPFEDSGRGRDAEPLYTLYIFDRHARNTEPYLQREIHQAGIRLDIFNGADLSEFKTKSEGSMVLGTGLFRYIANKRNGGFPLGIYRLRFRPKSKDTGIGIEAERQRVKRWVSALKKLGD